MANLGSLVVSLEANTAKFTSDMGKAAYQTEQAMQKMQRSSDMAKAAVVGLAQGAIGALSIDAFATMIKGAIDSMDALNDLKDATGASIENISALEDVAARTGANFDTVSTAMLKFQKLLLDAKPGSDAEAGLSALNLSAQTLKDMDLAEAMHAYARALDGFADDGNKARLVMDQTGKSVKELAPFLKDLAEQQTLVATVTTAQAAEAEKFNKELFNMKKNAQDLARDMAGPLAEAFNGFMENMRKSRREGTGLFSSMESMSRNEKVRLDAMRTGTWSEPENAGRGSVNPAFVKPSVVMPPEKKEGAAKGQGKDPDADFKAYMKHLGNQIAKVRELTAVEKLLADVKSGSLTVSPGQQELLNGIAQEIDATKEAVRISSERVELRRKDEQDSINAIREIEAETARQNQMNAANVENIRIGLMSEIDQETYAHELRLKELQKFHDVKLENVTQANALIEEENARHKQTLADMQATHDLQSLGMMGDAADKFYSILQKSGQDQTALGKAVFLATKAIAVAEIIMNTERAASAALATTGIFGIPVATMIRVTGYASAGMVAGMAIADASAEGGYDIPSGTNPITQLHEKEMVLPREHADVIRGLAGKGGASGGPMTLTIVNQTSGRIDKVTEQRISPTERALIIQEAMDGTASALSDPNSRTSRAMGRNYATQRSR